MQLAAFNNNNFVLGHSAMLINEGLPLYLVSRLEARYDLSELTVGMLGMAFKGGSDDSAGEPGLQAAQDPACSRPTECSAPTRTSPTTGSCPLDEVLARADLLVIGAPHPQYRDLADRRTRSSTSGASPATGCSR